ncbi:MAG TPA: hypothetical protein VGX50_10510, partial [Longimicrobium sp.]|nr:hypothetical protein [Longimicrobium sp.]
MPPLLLSQVRDHTSAGPPCEETAAAETFIAKYLIRPNLLDWSPLSIPDRRKKFMSPVESTSQSAAEEQLALEQRIMSEAEESLQPTPTPVPGRYYQIRKGDSLLVVAGQAYRVGEGSKRLDFARRINRHALNAKYVRKDKASKQFPEGLVSFMPHFSCDVRAQVKANETVPGGNCYAVIWIPLPDEAVHPLPVKAHDVPAWLVADLWKGQPPAAVAEDKDVETPATPGGPMTTSLKLIANTALSPHRFICSLHVFFPRPSQYSE